MKINLGAVLSLFILMVWSFPNQAQHPTTNVQQSAQNSRCSNNVVSAGGTITVTCSDLTPEQVKALLRLPGMLNRILGMQIPSAELSRRLDEIEKALSKPTNAVNGDNNLVGNVVTGSQNIVGNGNQLNVGLYPPRHLPHDLIPEVVTKYLSRVPANVLILYPANDSEAFNYASEISQMLKDAGWEVDGPTGAMTMGQTPLYGIEVRYNAAEKAKPNETINLTADNSWGCLALVLQAMQGGKDLAVDPEPNWDKSKLMINVFANPASRIH